MMDLIGILILAGGESARMGSPKALLTLPGGERLLDYHIRHALCINQPVMVADNGKGFCQNNHVSVISDYLANDSVGKGAGALSAIAGAMQALSDGQGYLLVISCDSLIHAKQLFDKLKNKCHQQADVIYLKDEKDYPLLGLYSLHLKAKLKDYLDKGNRSVMKFLAGVTVKTVDLPSAWKALANVNTPAEFQDATQQLIDLADPTFN